MSTTAVTPVLAPADRRFVRRPLLRATVAAGVVGAAVTTAVAAAIHAAGVSLSAGGEIPLGGFANITFICAALGGVVAAVVNRRSAAPRRRFVQIALALTTLSCLAPIALAAQASSMIALVATHLVAAAIIVPALASRIHD